jgi:hypothetical protein
MTMNDYIGKGGYGHVNDSQFYTLIFLLLIPNLDIKFRMAQIICVINFETKTTSSFAFVFSLIFL